MQSELSPAIEALEDALTEARAVLDVSPLRLLVACSGGIDSAVLLAMLLELRGSLPLELAVCHVNHGLRPAAESDQRFVEELCAGCGVQCPVRQAPPREEGVNVEAWARRIRYQLLEAERAQQGFHLIATAHHARDQAETLIFRAATGRLATSGFTIQRLDLGRRLIRPLLYIPKAQLEEFAAAHELRFVHDETNELLERGRNFVRHRLLPELAAGFGSAAEDNLALVAERLNADEHFLREKAQSMLAAAGTLDVQTLAAAPEALRWRVLAECARRDVADAGGTIGYAALQRAVELALLASPHERSLDLGRLAAIAIDRAGKIHFKLRNAATPVQPVSSALSVPGAVVREYPCSSVIVEAALVDAASLDLEAIPELSRQGDPEIRAVAYFDAEELAGKQLTVRERRDGDVVNVWQRGSRKLKKLLQEGGIVLTLRDRIPIVETSTNILWVPGVARSATAPVSGTSRQILVLTFERRWSDSRNLKE